MKYHNALNKWQDWFMERSDQVKFADLPQKLHITSEPSLWEEEIHRQKKYYTFITLSLSVICSANSETNFACQSPIVPLLIGKGLFRFR